MITTKYSTSPENLSSFGNVCVFFRTFPMEIHKVTNLTKDKRHVFQSTEEQSKAFFNLKRMLTNELYLQFPLDGYPLHSSTDASGIATGGILFQEING